MFEAESVPIDRALEEFFCSKSGLDHELNARFGKVIRTLSGALRDGHLCLDLEKDERELVARSSIVSEDGTLPLVLSDSRLYFSRYYKQEWNLANSLRNIAGIRYTLVGLGSMLDEEFPASRDTEDLQRKAAQHALTRALAIITGGPGTGKTTTIVKIVILLLKLSGPDLEIALAAPTGKAAVRMRESIRSTLCTSRLPAEILDGFPDDAWTLHRLLGIRGDGGQPRYNGDNPLRWDVVLVDEASMVDLPLMHKLVAALKPDSRLILLGDKDQLASVESGAVLTDCIFGLPGNVVELKKSYRFDASISLFADSVNRGDADRVWQLLADPKGSVRLAENGWIDKAKNKYRTFLEHVSAAAEHDDYPKLFKQFRSFQVLCAVKNGPRGVHTTNARLEHQFDDAGLCDTRTQWYPGRPVIITRNDYDLGLYNGDIGLCLPDQSRDGLLCVWFERGANDLQCFMPTRLPACETVWAMTIHKSQGSEFDEVMIVLPNSDNRVLCRELLYTAVTRGRERIDIVAEEEVCRLTVARKTTRFSGLAERLSSTSSV